MSGFAPVPLPACEPSFQADAVAGEIGEIRSGIRSMIRLLRAVAEPVAVR